MATVNCWAVIPIKASPESKSRLAEALDMEARGKLVQAMLARVLEAAMRARNVSRVCLIGAEGATGRSQVTLLTDPGGGLNAAASAALAVAADGSADRLIVIHGDLPLVSAQEIELLAAAPTGEIAIAADRHGLGTNAISLPLPQARAFAFAFGSGSLAQHMAEAERLGLAVEMIHGAGLARDIDEPADLADAADLLGQAQ